MLDNINELVERNPQHFDDAMAFKNIFDGHTRDSVGISLTSLSALQNPQYNWNVVAELREQGVSKEILDRTLKLVEGIEKRDANQTVVNGYFKGNDKEKVEAARRWLDEQVKKFYGKAEPYGDPEQDLIEPIPNPDYWGYSLDAHRKYVFKRF